MTFWSATPLWEVWGHPRVTNPSTEQVIRRTLRHLNTLASRLLTPLRKVWHTPRRAIPSAHRVIRWALKYWVIWDTACSALFTTR